MNRSFMCGVADACIFQLKGDTFPSVDPGGKVFVQRRGHGVVYVFCLCTNSCACSCDVLLILTAFPSSRGTGL